MRRHRSARRPRAATPAFADERPRVVPRAGDRLGVLGLVEATLGAVAQARAFADPDFFVLVLGQDYPRGTSGRGRTRSGQQVLN